MSRFIVDAMRNRPGGGTPLSLEPAVVRLPVVVECPSDVRHDRDVVGCGFQFVSTPDREGLHDCPNCGMWFREGAPLTERERQRVIEDESRRGLFKDGKLTAKGRAMADEDRARRRAEHGA